MTIILSKNRRDNDKIFHHYYLTEYLYLFFLYFLYIDNVVRVDYTILTLVADENGRFGMDIRSNNLALVVCFIEPGGPTDR